MKDPEKINSLIENYHDILDKAINDVTKNYIESIGGTTEIANTEAIYKIKGLKNAIEEQISETFYNCT